MKTVSPGLIAVYLLLVITAVCLLVALFTYRANFWWGWFNPWTHRPWYRLGLLPLTLAFLICIYHVSGLQLGLK
jgi:hypothetical protein